MSRQQGLLGMPVLLALLGVLALGLFAQRATGCSSAARRFP